MAGKTRKPRKHWPPIWLRILSAMPLVLILVVRVADVGGDRGIVKVNSIMLGVLFLFMLAPWFVFFSAYSRKLRFGLPLLGIAGIFAFFTLFEFLGVSGAMTPLFRSRFAEPPAVAAHTVTTGSSGIDLSLTSIDDFPGFLGRDRTGMVRHLHLDPDWTARPPAQVWKQPIGSGWSGFAVVNGVAVTMEQRGADEMVSAYDARTGDLLWLHQTGGPYSHPLGGIGPRSTPTIDAGRVYALGARGWLGCLDGATGQVVWEKDLLAEYGVSPEQEFRNIQYGRSNSPLVAGDLLIIPAGGDPGGRIVSLAAYDKRSGETVWEAGTRQISFASPSLATLAGAEQVLIVNEDNLSGHNLATGKVLWEYPWPGKTASNASASQAMPVPPNRVFVSKGYGGGAMLLDLSPGDDPTLTVREVWANGRVLRTKFTQVMIKGTHVYGLSDGILECAELTTGRRVWKRGRYEHGQILGVGDLLLVLTESGEIVLIEPTPDEPNKVLGRFQALEGQTWNNLALYGDLLLVRNSREAAVWRLPLAVSASSQENHRSRPRKHRTADAVGYAAAVASR